MDDIIERVRLGDVDATRELLAGIERGQVEDDYLDPVLNILWRSGDLEGISRACLKMGYKLVMEGRKRWSEWAIWMAYTAARAAERIDLVIRVLLGVEEVRGGDLFRSEQGSAIVLSQGKVTLDRYKDFQPGQPAWVVYHVLTEPRTFWPPKDILKECLDKGYLKKTKTYFTLGDTCPPVSPLVPPTTTPPWAIETPPRRESRESDSRTWITDYQRVIQDEVDAQILRSLETAVELERTRDQDVFGILDTAGQNLSTWSRK